MKQEIIELIGDVGTLASYNEEAGKIFVRIELKEKVSPLAKSLKRAIDEKVREAGQEPVVVMVEPMADTDQKKKKIEPSAKFNGVEGVKRVVIVASGKGGVGKSSVAAALARMLAARGEKVGVLDADIYGPSQPRLFGLEGAKPYANEEEMIVPVESEEGIKVNSIGFFIDPSQALVWRGPMATTALKQLIHQTAWGLLDTMVVDMPPGTGDVHLSVADQLKINAAVIVTTPSDLALKDVIRGVDMLKNENIAIPIVGIVNNMAYFAPEDAPDKKYFIFGDDTYLKYVAEQHSLKIVAEVPITSKFGEPIDIKYLEGIDVNY